MSSFIAARSGNVIEALRKQALPLIGAAHDFTPLIDAIGDSRIVLIGEASHGTHEFYEQRAEISKRLIREKGFSLVAIEGDWPDALEVTSYIQHGEPDTALEALSKFKRFPTWMWRNTVVLDFVEWLYKFNLSLNLNQRVGFFGLDLYSLYSSVAATIGYLEKVDPTAAERARDRYGCFDTFGNESRVYGYAASFGLGKSCENEVINQLVDLHIHAMQYRSRDGRGALDEFFYAEQNARVVLNAERYYRLMFGSRVSCWNLRDRHMVETLIALDHHYRRIGQNFKAIVWAHNSHLGDARATQFGAAGEVNIGQLVREEYPGQSFSIGFSTYAGSVTAASGWDGPAECKRVQPALKNSCEALFHQVGLDNFMLILRKRSRAADLLKRDLLQRAIGVIYLPETERLNHYFFARLSDQFDAIVHYDKTRALEPLEQTLQWQSGEPPETFPSGL